MIIPPMIEEGIEFRMWKGPGDPKHILLIRFHAFGDGVITLPILGVLRRRFPTARITMVTSMEYRSFFRECRSVDDVYGVNTRGSKAEQIAGLARLFTELYRPDLLLDLQRSRLSRMLHRMLRPRAWTRFDRFAPKVALDRYREAVEKALDEPIVIDYLSPITTERASELLGELAARLEFSNHSLRSTGQLADLLSNPAERRNPFICLNPAGCWETKNWSAERYAELGLQLVAEYNATILLIGNENVRLGADVLRTKIPSDHLIDLVDQTTLPEALALVGRLDLMVSDDSGLMHLAWTSGTPTIGLFGSSRTTWSRPCGGHSRTIGSEDLECSPCMSPVCQRGDLLCLERIDTTQILHLCRELLEHSPGPDRYLSEAE